MANYVDGDGRLIHVVKVRVSESDYRAWLQAAEDDHRDLADWIRMRVNGYKATPPPKPEDIRPRPQRDAAIRANATRLGASETRKKVRR